LLELGVNAVELLPVFEFDELEFKRFPNPRDHMVKFDNFLTHSALHIDQWSDPHLFIWKVNTWGYSTINFFAPMSRYASAGGGPVAASKELKKMVKALHNAGIEVLTSCMHGKSFFLGIL